MNYINGRDIFPSELLDLIQDYTQGKYVYIPKRNENKEKWGAKTSYKKELEMRNNHIYTKHLTGLSLEELASIYCLSIKSIRRILFNKGKEGQKMNENIKKILELWNINEELKQIYDTAWSVGNSYIIKAYNDLGKLNRNITIMKTLLEHGIPVAHIINTPDGHAYIEFDGKYYLLMSKLSGSHILNIYEENYYNIAYETGKVVAKLHTAFIACDKKITFWNNNLLDEMSGWIQDALKLNTYRYISKLDFETNLEELKRFYNQLPRQLIHRDIHYGNLLFNNGEFSGYIDFDLSQKNVRIFDICYFLIGLLANHDKHNDYIEKWFSITSRFIEGYEVTTTLSKIEKDSICCIMSSIELLFVAYFINNQDEVLAQSSANLYYFVNKNRNKIQSRINNYCDKVHENK